MLMWFLSMLSVLQYLYSLSECFCWKCLSGCIFSSCKQTSRLDNRQHFERRNVEMSSTFTQHVAATCKMVIILTTMLFNLHCNIVGCQVAKKMLPLLLGLLRLLISNNYYQALFVRPVKFLLPFFILREYNC